MHAIIKKMSFNFGGSWFLFLFLPSYMGLWKSLKFSELPFPHL